MPKDCARNIAGVWQTLLVSSVLCFPTPEVGRAPGHLIFHDLGFFPPARKVVATVTAILSQLIFPVTAPEASILGQWWWRWPTTEVPGGVLGGGAGVELSICQTHMISWLLGSADFSCWRCLPASNLGEDRNSSLGFQAPSSLWSNVARALVSYWCLGPFPEGHGALSEKQLWAGRQAFQKTWIWKNCFIICFGGTARGPFPCQAPTNSGIPSEEGLAFCVLWAWFYVVQSALKCYISENDLGLQTFCSYPQMLATLGNPRFCNPHHVLTLTHWTSTKYSKQIQCLTKHSGACLESQPLGRLRQKD